MLCDEKEALLKNKDVVRAWGRILQGDAVYLRDAAAPEQMTWAQSAKAEKLIKLAALFSVFGLPDCAAEILGHFRSRLARLIDVDRALDTLVADANGKAAPPYPAYMDEFERDAPRFYPKRGALRALQRLSDITKAILRHIKG